MFEVNFVALFNKIDRLACNLFVFVFFRCFFYVKFFYWFLISGREKDRFLFATQNKQVVKLRNFGTGSKVMHNKKCSHH